MKKNVFYVMFLLFVAVSCNRDELQNQVTEIEVAQKDPLNAKQINGKINESIKSTGSFSWTKSSDHLVWSAIFQGNKVASIGFGSSKDDFDRSLSSDNEQIQNEILALIEKYEGKEKSRVLLNADKYLNQMDVAIEKQETVIALRKMKNIRYLEPADYHYFENENKLNGTAKSSGSSGCGFESTALNAADYTTVTDRKSVV